MPALELTDLELAAGIAFGQGSGPVLPRTDLQPAQALADACVAGLRHEPCLVSFSGGRDSAAVLAIATRMAAQRGLAAPVPVTLRFPGVASTEESRWQELVIGHLGLSDWVRIEIGGELDFLGTRACEGLADHGLLWPANAHFHSPIFELAAGGTVLTGLDGDGLLGGWRWQRAQAVLAGRARPLPRDLMRVALALAPVPARAAVLGLRGSPHGGWLRPGSRRRLAWRLASETAGQPRRWRQRVQWFARRRYLQVGVHSLAMLARSHDVEVHHPLLDPVFLSALAAHGGPAGYGTRGRALRALLGDLLPAALLERESKAEFGMAFWGRQARCFAERWDGAGIDPQLVDAERLRTTWRQSNPPLAAATVLQHAWLISTRSSAAVPPPPAAARSPGAA